MADLIAMMAAAAGASAEAGDYEISRSLRFNSADSAYLSRTPASAGNRKTWTWSGWVKRSALGEQSFFDAYSNDSNRLIISFSSTNAINVFARTGGSTIINLTTSQLFRDVSAWYHFVFSVDTTQATDTNRFKIYINGVQVSSFSVTSYPTLDYETFVNATVGHSISSNNDSGGREKYFNGYLADINFIDGQALTPSSFGEVNEDTGVWSPIKYAGTYGTNGFHLDFSDNTSTTTLGYDASGSNDWTLNNFSVTAGAGNDSLVDSPTRYGTDTGAGGTVRGNYCTLNPLTTTAGTYTQGNLRYVGASAWRRSNATIPVSTGKWYWEVTLGNAPFLPRGTSSAYNAFGFGLSTAFNSTTQIDLVTDAVYLADNGWYKNFSGSWTDGGTAFSSGDTLAIAVDLDANTFTFYRNNTQITTGTIGGTAGRELVPVIISYDGSYGVMDANFGQRPFAYTAPSGFKALCTTNLPDPTIVQGDDYFNTVLYDGNGTSQSITGVGFQPDFVWYKERPNAQSHFFFDVLRGVNNYLHSNATQAEATDVQTLTAFNTDGFSVGSNTGSNESGATYVAWNWKANGAGVSNTAGDIPSTVSANTTAGISIVTYTGNGSAGATVGHGLGVAPKMIIAKTRNNLGDWPVYHVSLGNTKNLLLNTTGGETTSSSWWNNTTPSSTVITLGNNSYINGNTYTFVAYCFAEVEGFSKFGSYTGNGSTDGPFVYTGFRPAFVLIKISSTTGDWLLYDNKRNSYNVVNNILYPNANYAEAASGSAVLDFVSNGFKLRGSGSGFNDSGATFIYACFSSNPFKTSLAR